MKKALVILTLSACTFLVLFLFCAPGFSIPAKNLEQAAENSVLTLQEKQFPAEDKKFKVEVKLVTLIQDGPLYIKILGDANKYNKTVQGDYSVFYVPFGNYVIESWKIKRGYGKNGDKQVPGDKWMGTIYQDMSITLSVP